MVCCFTYLFIESPIVMLVNSIKFVFYLFGLQINYKKFSKRWHVIPFLIPLTTLFFIIFVSNKPIIKKVSGVSHLINLIFIGMHQVSYFLILVETNLKSTDEWLIKKKIERIDVMIQSRLGNTKKFDLTMKSIVKQHLHSFTFLLTLFMVNYLVILNKTRFLTDWLLSIIPRIVFYLFSVQIIIYMSVVEQKLFQVRRNLDADNNARILDIIEDVYIEVWEMCQMINYKFQISIGVVLLQFFLDMTITAFWGIEYIMALHPSSICEYIVTK